MIATIGFFDGMHEGHRYVISQLMELAEKRGDGTIVFTFDCHPASVFCPEKAPMPLLTPEEKMEKIAASGVEDVVMFEFDKEFASITAKEFLQILNEDYNVDTLLLGYDNHFGKKEKDENGNVIIPSFEDYVKMGKEEGVRIKRLKEFPHSSPSSSALNITDQNIKPQERATSSSLIRSLLLEGNICEANSRLGYCYTLSGVVVSGFQIGRKIGFPTANIELEGKLIPKSGVYAAFANINKDTQQLKSIVNIGKRPTFNGDKTTIEVHIIDFDDNIYDSGISINLVARLRDEQKFDNPEALIQQINKDKEKAMELLK